jgi:hypothetical protein
VVVAEEHLPLGRVLVLTEETTFLEGEGLEEVLI